MQLCVGKEQGINYFSDTLAMRVNVLKLFGTKIEHSNLLQINELLIPAFSFIFCIIYRIEFYAAVTIKYWQRHLFLD